MHAGNRAVKHLHDGHTDRKRKSADQQVPSSEPYAAWNAHASTAVAVGYLCEDPGQRRKQHRNPPG